MIASPSIHDPAAERIDVLRQAVARYLDAFNRMDLPAVMTFFTSDAVYEPGDGTRCAGPKAIRSALSAQLSGAYGSMVFDVDDLFFDPLSRKAVLLWTCHIDARRACHASWRTWIRVALGRLRYGSFVKFRGIDVLHFDETGMIEGKFSFAQHARLLLRKDLGPNTRVREHR